jgi:hypothetical protein
MTSIGFCRSPATSVNESILELAGTQFGSHKNYADIPLRFILLILQM